jgi:hypothetical protein
MDMVDFVKFYLRNASAIKNCDFLDFREKFNRKTGEVETYEIAKYKGMKFKIWDNVFLQVSGSLHKFKNDGLHNYNDFTHSMLCEVLHEFETSFGFDLKKCELHNIEFGVNILPPCNTMDVLENLINHKNIKFDSIKKGHYRQAEHSHFICKLYDKAFQYKLRGQNMRWELKFRKMQIVNLWGIYTLHDLLSPNWFLPVGKRLLEEWNQVLFFDKTILPTHLEPEIRDKKLLEWNNPNYWSGLERTKKCRELKKYKACVLNHSQRLHYQIENRIQKMWWQLQ